MIHSQVNHPGGRRRTFWRRRQQVLATFCFRYDAQLVPDLLANLDPIVDGWVAWDDRGSSEAWSDERKRFQALLMEARRLGARWVLIIDPDERLEAALADGLARLIERSRPTVWSFCLREMFTPTAYRVDGIWGGRLRNRLFSLSENLRFDDPQLHGKRIPVGGNYRLRNSGFNLYHLRMITPERRQLRRDLNNTLDPARALQEIGYDYLAEDENAILEEIPQGREFRPAHRDDGGTWTMDRESMAALGSTARDRPLDP